MPSPKRSLIKIAGIALLVLLAYLAYQQLNGRQPVQPNPSSEDSQNEPEELKTFESPELGLAFSYPAEWGEVNYRVSQGGLGSAVSGVIRAPGCSLENGCWATLEFAAATSDFEAPRGASIIETDGYTERDGKYYRILAGQEWLIDYRFDQVQARNISGLVIYGDARPADPATIAADVRQVIFNLPDSRYPAITFAYSTNQVPDERMRRVFESIELR